MSTPYASITKNDLAHAPASLADRVWRSYFRTLLKPPPMVKVVLMSLYSICDASKWLVRIVSKLSLAGDVTFKIIEVNEINMQQVGFRIKDHGIGITKKQDTHS